jgi:hypothetical protein
MVPVEHHKKVAAAAIMVLLELHLVVAVAATRPAHAAKPSFR